MSEDQVVERIKSVLAEAEPYVVGHGGHIGFVDWEPATGRVLVSLAGACEHCSLSSITLKFGLEEALKKDLPQVREVVAV
ncbi:MAG: NifU family protein [Candidatus Veblenbacteria bacterium]|nr:NifU family protein [Candidatus Veblenbacteria bacterium]MDZ4230040.1 NifU family protein [Candidatus Veblenbacteria bacterium]